MDVHMKDLKKETLSFKERRVLKKFNDAVYFNKKKNQPFRTVNRGSWMNLEVFLTLIRYMSASGLIV